MKKSLGYLSLMVLIALACNGCKGGSTPELDSTQLWPAGDASGKYGYIDKAGNMVIDAQFTIANPFSCGYAVVDNNKFINTKGVQQSVASLSSAQSFYYNYSVVYTLDQKSALINRKFKYAIEPGDFTLYSMTKDGIILKVSDAEDKQICTFVNAKGEQVIEKTYEGAQPFVDGVAAVSVDGKWGCIDANGQTVIQPTYQSLLSIGNERILFLLGDKFGLLDTKGVVRAQAEYESANLEYSYGQMSLWNEGWLPVAKDGKWGYIDKNGNVKLSFQYQNANMFSDGLAVVEQSERYTVIDTKGNIKYLMSANEEPLTCYHNGLILTVNLESATYQYRNESGEVIYSWKTSANAPAQKIKNQNITITPARLYLLK